MPFLRIQTNQPVDPDRREELALLVSRLAAEQLGKPERYVMVRLESGRTMIFAGTAAPAAYLELISLGLAADQCPALSAALCQWVSDHLGVPADRTYIEFRSPDRAQFGWDGTTFA